MPHPVLEAVLSAGKRNFALHSRLVSPKECEIVTEAHDFRMAHFVRGWPQDIRYFREPAKKEIVESHASEGEGVVWIESHGLLGRSLSFFILARTYCAPAREDSMW
jgi:hypothetical protein